MNEMLERAKEYAAQNVEFEWEDEMVVEFAASERLERHFPVAGTQPRVESPFGSSLHDFWCDEPKCLGPCNCHLSKSNSEQAEVSASRFWKIYYSADKHFPPSEAACDFAEAYFKYRSVAGRQPTPDKMQQEMAGLRFRIHNLERHNQYFFRCESAWCHPADKQFQNPALETFKEALVISAGAAQGRPQVEVLVAELAEGVRA
jgi:hypothetical protein